MTGVEIARVLHADGSEYKMGRLVYGTYEEIETWCEKNDMWVDRYWGDSSVTKNTYKEWGVTDYITLDKMDFFEWIKEPEEFDFLYFDINNTGEKLELLYNKVKNQIKNGSVVFFEGGSKERDLHGVDGKNMYDIKDKIGYEILTDNIKYSASTIYNSKIYNMDFE